MAGWGIGKAGGVFNAPSAPAGVVPIAFNERTGTWAETPERVALYRSKGMKMKWIGSATDPTPAHGYVAGDLRVKPGANYVPPPVTPPTATDLTVTYASGAWDKTTTQINAARATGGKITWAGTTVLPTPANGLVSADKVTGTFTQGAPAEPLAKIGYGAWAYPKANDAAGASNDTITLQSVPGITWTVLGTDYPSDSFSGSKAVPSGANASVTVTAKPTDAAKFEIISGVPKTWTLTFDVAVGSSTPVSIAAGSEPKATNNGATATFGSYVTLTSVPNIIWTVDGVDYPSANFTGTRNVTYLKGTNTTVTARVTGPEYTLNGTSSWTLTFTNANGNTPLDVVGSASFDNIKGQSYTSAAASDNYTVVGGLDGAFGGGAKDFIVKKSSTTYISNSGELSVDTYLGTVWPQVLTSTRNSRYVEFVPFGNGAGGGHSSFRVNIFQVGTSGGVALDIADNTVTVQSNTNGTLATIGTGTLASKNSGRVGVGFDRAKNKVYLVLDNQLKGTWDYNPGAGAVTGNVAVITYSGSLVNRIDNLIGFGAA